MVCKYVFSMGTGIGYTLMTYWWQNLSSEDIEYTLNFTYDFFFLLHQLAVSFSEDILKYYFFFPPDLHFYTLWLVLLL